MGDQGPPQMGGENITVMVRVRPSLKSEAGTASCVVCEEDVSYITSSDSSSLTLAAQGRTITTSKGRQVNQLYFDRVIDANANQATVFECARRLWPAPHSHTAHPVLCCSVGGCCA